jgi:trehalose 6-phosphate phosphatase
MGGLDDPLPGRLVDVLRSDPARALIALDYDGTLAPIVADPADARPAGGAVSALRDLARAGFQIAIITGRDAATVIGLGGLDAISGLIVSGVHGAQSWRGGKVHEVEAPYGMDRLREQLPGALERVAPGVPLWVEDKKLSLVIHARRATDPDAALATVTPTVTALAEAAGLVVHSGRSVLELRIPGLDKGAALRDIVAETGRTRILFAGDDLGDLPAFAAVAELRTAGRDAWSIAIASAEQPTIGDNADLVLDDPAALVQLLERVSAAH